MVFWSMLKGFYFVVVVFIIIIITACLLLEILIVVTLLLQVDYRITVVMLLRNVNKFHHFSTCFISVSAIYNTRLRSLQVLALVLIVKSN